MPETGQSTYSLLTADNILRDLGVQMPKKVLAGQLADPQAFYHLIVRLPAEQLYNYLLLDQAQSMTDYAQYLAYDSQSRVNRALKFAESDSDTSMPLTSVANQIDTLNETLKQLNQDIQGVTTENAKLKSEIRGALVEQIAAWQQTQAENYQTILAALEADGIKLNDEQQELLRARLDQEGAGIEIPKEVLKQLKIKSDPTPAQKAVIMTLMEVENA